MLRLTVVIPAYNEGESIFETILEIDAFIPNTVTALIFVSEDGSVDNTREEVLRAASFAKNSTVLLSAPSSRLGYSRAVQRGILECDSELICFMDADGQFDPRDIKRLVQELKSDIDIVIGYRNPRVDGLNRIVYSRMFGAVYKMMGGPKRIDPSSPFILAKTNKIKSLGGFNFRLSFGFWWEFQWRIQKLGLSYLQIPVKHRVRSSGATQVYTFNKLPKIIRTHLIGLWKLRAELKD